MLRGRFQYAIPAVLVSILAMALGVYYVMLPTARANQFAQAIRSGNFAAARNIFPDTGGGRYVFWPAESTVCIKPVTALNLWNGTREVTVTDFENYRYTEFTITRNRESSFGISPLSNGLMEMDFAREYFGASPNRGGFAESNSGFVIQADKSD